MKTLYLDVLSGISGDMFIGAMLDLGVDFERLREELGKLSLEGYHLHVRTGSKCNISGTKFDVHLGDHHHSHSETHPPEAHGHEDHAHAHGASHNHPHTPDEFPEQRHGHPHSHSHSHPHSHDDPGHQHGHQPTAASEPGHQHTHEHEHTHENAHVHPHEHTHGEHEHTHDQHEHGRSFSEIKMLIEESTLSSWVKQRSIAVFRRIAVAEGRIHNMPPEQVAFHEVGAIDSIVDIVGACVALEMLGKPRVLSASVTEGTGWINCAHGRFPIPAPATLAILAERKIPVSQCDEPNELVTPTGAALLAELAESFGPMRDLVPERIGYGLGTRDNRTRPNVLRAVLGESTVPAAALDWETDTIVVLETNLDDVTGEVAGYVVEKALAAGALDVFHAPISMKKNRPGLLLTILCEPERADGFCELLLRETTAFGVRRYSAERRKLRREIITVDTEFGPVEVKVGALDGKVVQTSPEYESCRRLAQTKGVPVREVYASAIAKLRGNAVR